MESEDFTHQSPFVYADNNPVRFIDFMGMYADEADSLKQTYLSRPEEHTVNGGVVEGEPNEMQAGVKTFQQSSAGTIALGLGAGAEGIGGILTRSILSRAALLTIPLTFTGDTDQRQRDVYSYVAYVMYFLEGPYVGRTQGWGTPKDVLMDRLVIHHVYPRSRMLPLGVTYEARTSIKPDPDLHNALRGREQQWIDHFGGPRNGTLNLINGISPNNPKRPIYMNAAYRNFGSLPTIK